MSEITATLPMHPPELKTPAHFCRFCSKPAEHALDAEWYCCTHFDELVEHSATIHFGVLSTQRLSELVVSEALERGLQLAKPKEKVGFSAAFAMRELK